MSTLCGAPQEDINSKLCKYIKLELFYLYVLMKDTEDISLRVYVSNNKEKGRRNRSWSV